MNVRDWTAFIRDGHGTTLKLAQLDGSLTAHLGAASNVVHLHHDYAVKAIQEHQLLPAHLPMLDETIDQGAVIQDGNQTLVFFHYDEYVWEKWFKVAVKRCNERRLLWVHTIHKSDWSQVRSKMRRLPVLRPLKT